MTRRTRTIQSATFLLLPALAGLWYFWKPGFAGASAESGTPAETSGRPMAASTSTGQKTPPAPAFAAPAGPATATASWKIGTVDMQRVFMEYHKTRAADRKLNEDKGKAKKEMDERVAKHKELAGKLSEIDKILRDKLVNEQLKQQKRAEGQVIFEKANAEARDIEEFRSRRELQLKDVSDRMRKVIVQEIVEKLGDKAKRENYDFVFDRSGISLTGTPMLPVSREAYDFSSELIVELNRNAPPAPPQAASGE